MFVGQGRLEEIIEKNCGIIEEGLNIGWLQMRMKFFIIWNRAGLLLIAPLETNFSEIWIQIK